jgi:hypothetical protein
MRVKTPLGSDFYLEEALKKSLPKGLGSSFEKKADAEAMFKKFQEECYNFFEKQFILSKAVPGRLIRFSHTFDYTPRG